MLADEAAAAAAAVVVAEESADRVVFGQCSWESSHALMTQIHSLLGTLCQSWNA